MSGSTSTGGMRSSASTAREPGSSTTSAPIPAVGPIRERSHRVRATNCSPVGPESSGMIASAGSR